MIKNSLNIKHEQLNRDFPSDLVELTIKPISLTEQELIRFIYDIDFFFAGRDSYNNQIILVSQNQLNNAGLDFKFQPYRGNAVLSKVKNLEKCWDDYGFFI